LTDFSSLDYSNWLARETSQFGSIEVLSLVSHIVLDSSSEVPLYRQLAESIQRAVDAGALRDGDRLPATRELAGQLGLNRTTVSAAYTLLEQSGSLQGLVGRGSFVVRSEPAAKAGFDWENLLAPLEVPAAAAGNAPYNFASSRPAEDCFPMAQFRRLSKEVIDSPGVAELLQLGSPHGYAPLRRYLLDESAAAGAASPSDDLIVTNGCQQALDLLARILVEENTPVLLEDPVYHGLLRVFGRARVQLLPVPVTGAGVDLNALERLATQHRPRLLVLTPDFQNPTGGSLSLDQRRAVIALSARLGIAIIEISIYRELRYRGESLPSLKQLDVSGGVISIGSYSKVAFPGLRIGWVIAPRPVIARLADAKQTSDLHSDQLSQAVLLRFAESGELRRHIEQTRRLGAERLSAALESCAKAMPSGTRTSRPEGGMNLWVDLPAPLTAEALLQAARERGVSFLPGSYFSARDAHRRALRLAFGGLSPKQIATGIGLLGAAAREQLRSAREMPLAAGAALV
jgi:DNA-binding transcriptional MocR family regulator